MELIEALYTTRAMRRLGPDPVPEEVQARMFDAAIRAPSGSNALNIRLMTVADPATKVVIGDLYRDTLEHLNKTIYAASQESMHQSPADPALDAALRMDASARYLADHLAAVPLLIFAFGKEGGESSVFPILWSLCLAARGEGYGTVLTTLLGRVRDAVHTVLGVPPESEWMLMAMVPCGLPLGKWNVAPRRPAHEVVYSEQWEQPPPWRADRPLWSPET